MLVSNENLLATHWLSVTENCAFVVGSVANSCAEKVDVGPISGLAMARALPLRETV